MKTQKNIPLKKFNTFGIAVKAKQFIEIKLIKELVAVLKEEENIFTLSGGSNILLTKDIEKLVLFLNIKGIKIIKETKNIVYVNANAGENWHEFVQWSIKNNFGGLENLSLIPGNVGTSPIQNIGAYGVEVKDTIKEVHAIDIKTQKKVVFKNENCAFGYRNSVFKNKLKNKYIITNVLFKLTKENHKLHYSYGAIQQELKKNKIVEPTIKNIANAVINIRQRKLPNPKEIGNCGSFFKNPIVTKDVFDVIYKLNDKMPFYKTTTNYKIPAGWLIEQCGFKGKRFGDAGVHKNQALVLVNYGNATGNEILSLANNICESVKQKFKINLETEVNIF
ncbi:MAG: UDP-N-acetylmuramate dehydrogenase [Flavobacteriaceae bacterium]|nr:UDP-N-acetylmuramate dehydrogenase [Flavobacteriaceae bacterium]